MRVVRSFFLCCSQLLRLHNFAHVLGARCSHRSQWSFSNPSILSCCPDLRVRSWTHLGCSIFMQSLFFFHEHVDELSKHRFHRPQVKTDMSSCVEVKMTVSWARQWDVLTHPGGSRRAPGESIPACAEIREIEWATWCAKT